jgi:hypothetical protein
MTIYAAYSRRVQGMSLEQVVSDARRVLERVRENGLPTAAPVEGGHSLVDVFRTAFAPTTGVMQAAHVEFVPAPPPAAGVVETAPPPKLRPVPTTTAAVLAPPASFAPPTASGPSPQVQAPQPAAAAGHLPVSPAGPKTPQVHAPEPGAEPVTNAAAFEPSAPLDTTPVDLTTKQMLLLLKDSPYAAVREVTVRRLVSRGKVTMPVAEALLSGALSDKEAGVRAACLRGLKTLGVTGPALVAACQKLGGDPDTRVREAAVEVSLWLQTLSAGPAPTPAGAAN